MSVYAVTSLSAATKQANPFQTVRGVFDDPTSAQAWIDAAQVSPAYAKCSNWAIQPCELNPALPEPKGDVSVCGEAVPV